MRTNLLIMLLFLGTLLKAQSQDVSVVFHKPANQWAFRSNALWKD